jgi:hypothetical protein
MVLVGYSFIDIGLGTLYATLGLLVFVNCIQTPFEKVEQRCDKWR